jgi:hypothetical protein
MPVSARTCSESSLPARPPARGRVQAEVEFDLPLHQPLLRRRLKRLQLG